MFHTDDQRDEKVTLISQIVTLQGQQEALGSRLESLTQAADNAVDREREAEDRLDRALTQHARQISQRQVRVFHTMVHYILHHVSSKYKHRREKQNLNALYKNSTLPWLQNRGVELPHNH